MRVLLFLSVSFSVEAFAPLLIPPTPRLSIVREETSRGDDATLAKQLSWTPDYRRRQVVQKSTPTKTFSNFQKECNDQEEMGASPEQQLHLRVQTNNKVGSKRRLLSSSWSSSSSSSSPSRLQQQQQLQRPTLTAASISATIARPPSSSAATLPGRRERLEAQAAKQRQ
jgi:hypothetical protein